MSFKNTLLVSAGLALTGLASCKTEVEQKATSQQLLERMKTYSEMGAPSDLYSTPLETDGQFVSMIIDSADVQTRTYHDVGPGYACVMDHLSPQQNKTPFTVKGVKIISNTLSNGINPYSFEVHLTHPSVKAELEHKNNTKTNLAELKLLGKYSTPLTSASAGLHHGNEEVPVDVFINAPKGFTRAKLDMAYEYIQKQKDENKLSVLSIKRDDAKEFSQVSPSVYKVDLGALKPTKK